MKKLTTNQTTSEPQCAMPDIQSVKSIKASALIPSSESSNIRIDFPILLGKNIGAPRILIYGVEGVGKSTLASKFKNPLIVDIEDRTRHIDCARFIPEKFTDIINFLDIFSNDKNSISERVGYDVKTLVIDTLDWLQKHVTDYICTQNRQPSIEAFGYGKGWVMVGEWMSKVLKKLDAINKKGITVVCVCHSTIRKFEDPTGATYDRYTLKLLSGDKISVSDMFKEWADTMLFLNYMVSKTDDGEYVDERYILTERTSRYDAKNSHGLPPMVKLDDYQTIIDKIYSDCITETGDTLLEENNEELTNNIEE